ncbi:LytR/AlgR family response regulator transcription factor [Maribacter thermophilus]|uniref:LytR/AlgR family response regulator transcription factor n=1 Tax=Maribacter thermophilus TaxID=1197874 RepID=UPI000640C426|nr:LytTR family DNA-binding domain-containing protein [Maribacter thermophilus]
MKAIVIDDEEKARDLLFHLLKEYCPQIHQISLAKDLFEGVEKIKKERPDIVFLDIEMPQASGLELLDHYTDEVNFQIIFTTAYSSYAVDAFKLNAIDYLLKPIDSDELKVAVEKAEVLANSEAIHSKIEHLRTSLKMISLNKIALEVPKGILFVSYNDILYFEADGMYTTVYMKKEGNKTICKPLKFFAEQLADNNLFFKCHRSYLINLKYVEELVREDGDYLLMENKKRIPVSKSKKEEFISVVRETFW